MRGLRLSHVCVLPRSYLCHRSLDHAAGGTDIAHLTIARRALGIGPDEADTCERRVGHADPIHIQHVARVGQLQQLPFGPSAQSGRADCAMGLEIKRCQQFLSRAAAQPLFGARQKSDFRARVLLDDTGGAFLTDQASLRGHTLHRSQASKPCISASDSPSLSRTRASPVPNGGARKTNSN